MSAPWIGRRCSRTCPLPTCFIIAPTATKLDPLTRVVLDAGWRVLNLESVQPGAQAFRDTTIELIRRADAVLVVLPDHNSPNTLVETGVAMGMERPLLLIAEDSAVGDGRVPDRLLVGLPRVRAKLGNGDALRFHVGAFLDGVRQDGDRSRSSAASISSKHGKAQIGTASRSESQLESRLRRAFEAAAEVEAVHLEAQLEAGRRFRPDFALWLHDPRQVIPNPLIIELVGSDAALRGGSKRRLGQLEKYALESGVGAVMLVEDTEQQPLSLLRLSPMIFRVGLAELEALLAGNLLIPEMVRARNLLAHSAG